MKILLFFLYTFLTMMETGAETNFGEIYINETVLLLTDIQTGFSTSKTYNIVVKTANKLSKVANALKIPIYASQHTPTNYGHIDRGIVSGNISIIVYQDNTFSRLTYYLNMKLSRDVPSYQSVILMGLEAHISVEQTAIAFRKHKKDVFIVAEGISSVNDYDKMFSIERLRQYGCYVETIESLVYKLLKTTTHPKHDEIVSIIKGNA